MSYGKTQSDLHDIFNKGRTIDAELNRVVEEAVAKGSLSSKLFPAKERAAEKHVLRFLEQPAIKSFITGLRKTTKILKDLCAFPALREHPMALISLQEISVAFGGPLIFDRLSLQLESRERVALLGRNGVGKTTLMKVIAGHTGVDGARLSVSRGSK